MINFHLTFIIKGWEENPKINLRENVKNGKQKIKVKEKKI